MPFKVDAPKIKRWREERHWSQEHLAQLAGIGLRTLQRIENGENASSDTVTALAAAFDVEAMALSVDVEHEAAEAAALKTAEVAARMRQSFYVHLAAFAFSLAIFAVIAVSSGEYDVLQVWMWWAITLIAHGLVVVFVPLSERENRKWEQD